MSINIIKFYQSTSFNPHENLSLEEKLMDECKKDELIFYLWQNKDTVVIGKNQSAKDQCDLESMKENNITLARRSSGGGAVYHDMGNLNFTFITKSKDFDLNKNLQVVIEALKEFNINAVFSGRNDLLVDGFKISGQAYLKTKEVSLHHGTLLVDVNINHLLKYLKTDKTKLKKHGVQSHVQRVKNISHFNTEANVSNIVESLKRAVVKVFDCNLVECKIQSNKLTKKYSSDKWLYRLNLDGKRIQSRFDYGLLDINLKISNNVVVDVQINSDLMDVSVISQIKNSLINKKYNHSLLGLISIDNKEVESDLIKMIEGDLCTT